MRAVKAGELFTTFIFDGKDCANMGIYNVTSGSVYTFNIEPMFSDSKLEDSSGGWTPAYSYWLRSVDYGRVTTRCASATVNTTGYYKR